MLPLVSVITPCYNQASFMSDTLQSVLGQTYANWECIIVNDGSTDGTSDVARKFLAKDTRFKYLPQKNGGLSNARNAGLKIAKGDYIQLLDSDDLIEKDKLKSAVDLYQSTAITGSTIVYSSMRYFEDKEPALLKILGRQHFVAHVEARQEDDIESQRQLLAARNPFVISAPVYPASLFKAIGNFDESLKALEDWDFNIRCVNAGYKFHHYYGNSSRTLIRLHDSSMMRDQKLLDDNFFRLLSKHNIRTTAPAKKEPFIKNFLRQITPPIITRGVKYLIK